MELNVGTNIKRLRLAKGLTQEQLAELSLEDSAGLLMSIANLFASNEVKYKKAGKGNHTDAISRFYKRRSERMRKH